MTYLISYRHTGAKEPRLGNLQQAIKEAFEARGEEFYSTYFNQDKFDTEGLNWAQIMQKTLLHIEKYDVLFVVLDSNEKSEGMLIEVGYCIAKGIPIIIAQNTEVTDTYFPALATTAFTYDSMADLKTKIINLTV